MAFSSLCVLKSRHIDYVQAFAQAKLLNNVFMSLPEGFHATGISKGERQILKLKKTFMASGKQRSTGMSISKLV